MINWLAMTVNEANLFKLEANEEQGPGVSIQIKIGKCLFLSICFSGQNVIFRQKLGRDYNLV